MIDELAPAVVVRAARFPLSALMSLGEAAPEGDYDATIEAQRARLWALTAGDPRFTRALTITNEPLAARLDGQPGRRNKRARHLETTLYRYLARAVWRTNPCDLWTGVALATWGARTEVTPQAPRYSLAPDLLPYQELVQALAASEPYLLRGELKLNPSLERAEDGWHYTVRNASAQVTSVHQSARLDRVIETLREIPPAELPAHLAGPVMVALRRAGILIGGLQFPVAFSSPWDALAQVAKRLLPAHARVWRLALLHLRRLCRRLEGNLDDVPLGDLRAALTEARAIPLDLARALDLPAPKVPRAVLRCDADLGQRIVLGPALRAQISETVTAFDAFERRHGLDAAVRAAHRHRLLSRPTSQAPALEGVPTLEWAWARGGADPLLGTRLRRWQRSLAEGALIDEPASELLLPPLGALLLRPSRAGFTITGSTTEIVAAYGRYGQLWNAGALHAWTCATLRGTAERAGLRLVEYVGPCESAPNGLARPRLDLPVWDRWGTTSTFDLSGARVELRAGAPVLMAGQEAVVLLCPSPLNLGYSDPTLERALLTSFREIPRWIWPGLPLEQELEADAPSPRLSLPGGEVVQPRRLVLSGAALDELVQASRPERYRLWQALAHRHQWPPLLLVTRDAGSPVPVVRDSPLALEAALEGLGQGVTYLTIEEPDAPTFIVDDCVAELLVPFLRRHHAWSALAPGQREPASVPGEPRAEHAHAL